MVNQPYLGLLMILRSLKDEDLVQLLPAGHSVGSIRTRRPLMYVFSGGNEDAAFFSVNGFSILLDGGDRKDVSYWNLIRNYDKISAAVVTRISPKCLLGISAIFMRKCLEECHPNFGSIICNLPPPNVVNGDSEAAKVLSGMHKGLRAESLKPIEAFATSKMEAITLYEVIGEGALRMIVLNPERGTKDLTSLVNALKTDIDIEKFAALTSLALLLVWHPSDHTLPVSRILITGACPLEKLYASLEKLKSEEYLRYPQFTHAAKDKSSNVRLSRIGRNSSTTKIVPRLPSARNIPTQSTTSSIREPLKKTARPPLSSSLPSRVTANSKKPVMQLAKAHTGNKSAENKIIKSALSNETKRTGVLTTKSKAREIAEAKSTNKLEAKPILSYEKAQNSDSVPANVEIINSPIKNPVLCADLPSTEGMQSSLDLSPSEVSLSGESKSPLHSEDSQRSGSPFAEKVANDNNLLDGIEEPVKLRKISMDFVNESEEMDENSKEKVEPREPKLNLIDSSLQPQDTLLLDSTPPASGIVPVGEMCDSLQVLLSKEEITNDDEDAGIYNQEDMRKKSIQDLLGSGTSPFMAGLITGIVDDTPTALHELTELKDAGSKKSESLSTQSLNELNEGKIEPEHSWKSDDVENKKPQILPGIQREVFSLRSNISSDSVNAQPDPVLDEVIESLADASEMVDNAENMSEQLEHHVKHSLAGLCNNVELATGTAATCATSVEQSVDFTNNEITSIAHDVNDNTKALAYQDTYEEVNAKELYLPPMTMTTTPRTRAKIANGMKMKPKLSQPLYFDIVFVPHHGAQPIVKDEEAAKAFVTSIRSRRYVLSGKDSIRTYFIDGLIAGKTAWNKPELEVDVLPTHDSEQLIIYSYEKAGEMAKANISLRCSVERCTLRLSSAGSDDVCPAFKFEM
ncbi:unnamed protein product [Thelazia callipaeda]|uniref:Microtubule-associated protein futsch n=1 Tax=Thelazia callipaeda TaxID=103827 RepID=A0A0N5D0Q4_THECL|nr:unnamed protein product [Thelazia callipaeda]